MTDYQEYPLTLAHPHFKPSKVSVRETVDPHTGRTLARDYQGTPVRYPPVVVNNADEEEFYKAEGYARAGQMDPSAWVDAHADAPPDTYVPQKYPMWRDGKLIKSIEDDAEASKEERQAAIDKRATHERVNGGVPTPPIADQEAQNLRAQLDEMQKQMAALRAEMASARAPDGDGEAQEEPLQEPAPRRPGRPRKTAGVIQ